MARLGKPKDEIEIALDKVDEDLSAFAAEKVKADPRGAPIVPAPTCILDTQAVNSVLVMLQWTGEPMYPHLQTPSGEVAVPVGDLSWTLPLLGEIKKVAADRYIGKQRDDPYGKPPLVCTSAVDAVKMFKRHFHDARD